MHYRQRILQLEQQIEDLNAEARRRFGDFIVAVMEEMVNPEYEQVAVKIFGEPFEFILVQIKAAKAELEPLYPCEAFVERFGIGLHDAYREEYPINRQTIVANWYGDKQASTVYYAIPEPERIIDFSLKAVPMYIEPRHKEATFKNYGWRNPDGYVWYKRLAWCPEINTVYVV